MMNKFMMSALLLMLVGCSNAENKTAKEEEKNKQQQPTHNYGGWYCPDNLFGFPAVDFNHWKNVPVIENRLPTEEETKTEQSLIFVDTHKYPDARALNISLPQLAKYYCPYTKKEEVVIIIQAIQIGIDSIVGFRYLNGGNGSSHYSEVEFINENEVSNLQDAKFVDIDIEINTTKDKLWAVINDTNNKYEYAKKDDLSNGFGDLLFGNLYIQNDYLIDNLGYTDKFLLISNYEKNTTELKIVCGPYLNDYDTQNSKLKAWAEKIKMLSEK